MTPSDVAGAGVSIVWLLGAVVWLRAFERTDLNAGGQILMSMAWPLLMVTLGLMEIGERIDEWRS